MKFLHAADLHIDSPLRGLDAYQGAPVDRLRIAARDALRNLVQLAIDENVAFVLIAGDVFDGDWPDYNTGVFFMGEMGRLAARGIPVYIVRGNHDAESVMSRQLRAPPGVHFFSTQAPETKILEAAGVALHGMSYATKAVTENLALRYPPAVLGLINIGILHTSGTGREGHENYAPCTDSQLLDRGYQYWALGHIHKREHVETNGVHVVFPGNLQGRHAKETAHEGKGATLVTCSAGRIEKVEHRALDVVRWFRCEVDLRDAANFDDAMTRAISTIRAAVASAGGRLCAIRTVLSGRTASNAALRSDRERVRAELIAGLSDLRDSVWLEKVEIETADEADHVVMDGAMKLVRDAIAEVENDPALKAELLKELGALQTRISPVAADLRAIECRAVGSEAVDHVLKSLEAHLTGRFRG